MFDLKYEQQKQQKIYQKYQIKQLNKINKMLNAKIIRIRNEEIKLLEEKEKLQEIIQEAPKETIQEINKYNISTLPLEHQIAFIVNNIFSI